jgi:hypothetical protein
MCTILPLVIVAAAGPWQDVDTGRLAPSGVRIQPVREAHFSDE